MDSVRQLLRRRILYSGTSSLRQGAVFFSRRHVVEAVEFWAHRQSTVVVDIAVDGVDAGADFVSSRMGISSSSHEENLERRAELEKGQFEHDAVTSMQMNSGRVSEDRKSTQTAVHHAKVATRGQVNQPSKTSPTAMTLTVKSKIDNTFRLLSRNFSSTLSQQQQAAQRCPFSGVSMATATALQTSTSADLDLDEAVQSETAFQTVLKSPSMAGSAAVPLKNMHELPGPFGWPIVGNFLTYFKKKNRNKMHEVQARQHQQYGKLFREKWGFNWQVHVSDPALIEEIYRNEGRYPNRPSMPPWQFYRTVTGKPHGLSTAQGAEWHRYRSELSRQLLLHGTRSMVKPFDSVSEDLVTRLRRVRDEHGPRHLVTALPEELHNWSLESAGTFLFETRLGCLAPEIPARTVQFIAALKQMMATSVYLIVMPQLHHRWNTPVWRQHAASWDTLHHIGKELIDQRLESLRHSTSDGATDTSVTSPGVFLGQMLTNRHMSVDEICSNVTDLLIGATDTTANSFCFIAYLLAKHPDVQQKLSDEISRVLNGRREVTSSDLDSMKYMKCVIKEGLRLYPVTTMNCRLLQEDIVLDGYLIPKQTTFVLNNYASCRDKDVFPEADHFRPERWSRDGTASRSHPFAYVPFGYGVRSCIGQRIVKLELAVVLTKVLQNFALDVYEGVEFEPKLNVLLTPGINVPIRLTDRHRQMTSSLNT